MTKLPTGTVTLLFTDIEGSTRLLERLGDRYVEVLGEHHQLLRAAFSKFHGYEFGTEGDAFFVAFARASDAVAAAVAGQRTLAAHPWPNGMVLRVRIGIHTGEPIVVGQDYAGLDVHRTARICSAGHGGQVLLSGATRELLGAELPSAVRLRDLGEFRLKDLTAPQRLFQLVISGLPADFPALRTLDSTVIDLPMQLTRFVGRQRELADICALLARDGVRLLTLTGPGGTGKTRLAMRAAANLQGVFPDGVVLVELASVHDPALVLPTIAQTLGIRETPGQSLLEGVAQHVGDRRLLLVVDNFEQVLAIGPSVVELLATCVGLKALVTSRVALHLSGEHTYPVPPLSLPEREAAASGPDDVLSSEAVTLFIDRARAVDPRFSVTDATTPVLAEICRRLDGLPLAIELAAAHIRLLSPQALLSRLGRRLQLLKGGPRDVSARQQTLRATIDWSYDLLEAGEQTLFARFAIFAGGCTLEAAEAVCDLESDLDVLAGLTALVDKNLLHTRDGPDGDSRLQMLETVREYALERLAEREEAGTVAGRHADCYLGLAERAEPELLGPRQGVWYERLEADLENFRAALAWSLSYQDGEVSGRLAGALMWFWDHSGRLNEGVRWLDAALEHRGSLSRFTLAKALLGRSHLLLKAGAGHRTADEQFQPLEESRSLFRELGDTTWTIHVVSTLGWAAMRADRTDRGLALHEQAVTLARGQEDRSVLSSALGNLGLSLLMTEQPARARAPLEESLALDRSLGDLEGIAVVLDGLAMLALGEGDRERAAALLEEALALARRVGHVLATGNYLAHFGVVVLHEGEYDRARTLLEEALTFAEQVEDELLVAQCLWGLAVVAAAQSQPVRAVHLWGAAENLRYSLAMPSFAVRPLEERLLRSVRDTLGEDQYRAERARAQAMDREDVIAYARDHR